MKAYLSLSSTDESVVGFGNSTPPPLEIHATEHDSPRSKPNYRTKKDTKARFKCVNTKGETVQFSGVRNRKSWGRVLTPLHHQLRTFSCQLSSTRQPEGEKQKFMTIASSENHLLAQWKLLGAAEPLTGTTSHPSIVAWHHRSRFKDSLKIQPQGTQRHDARKTHLLNMLRFFRRICRLYSPCKVRAIPTYILRFWCQFQSHFFERSGSVVQDLKFRPERWMVSSNVSISCIFFHPTNKQFENSSHSFVNGSWRKRFWPTNSLLIE